MPTLGAAVSDGQRGGQQRQSGHEQQGRPPAALYAHVIWHLVLPAGGWIGCTC